MNVVSGIKRTILLIFCFPALAAAADSISGRVLNKTTNTPSSGDDVVLLRLANGMEEEARTKADAQGAFSLQVSVPEAKHIVRVLHQGVNYDQTVNGTAVLNIEVFDSANKISGLSGKLGIAQVESEGKLLKITEMYSIENTSIPPVTQLGPHNFEISLPSQATLDSVMAKRATGVWVNVAPSLLQGQKGHYSLDFPLRPGETLFKFIYHLPYQGRATLRLKLPYAIESFGVVHPPSMTFRASRPQAFSSPGVVQGLKLEQATSPVADELPAFEISGSGAAPPHDTVAQAPPATIAPAVSSARPVAAPTAPEAATKTPDKEIWFVTGAIAVLLVAAVFLLLRRKRTAALSAIAAGAPAPLVEALKEELFQLETERLHGAISAEQYASTKQALNLSIQRALAREKG